MLSGALIGFGLVGFLTGLVLVPFGVTLAVLLGVRRQWGSGAAWVGAALGPLVLLYGDLTVPTPPSGVAVGFSIGVGLAVLGSAMLAVQIIRRDWRRTT
jgi:hypothetical protein